MYSNKNNYNQDPECIIMLRNIPRELRRRFKGWCATRGETMTNVMRQFMCACVTGDQEQLSERLKHEQKRRKKKRVL